MKEIWNLIKNSYSVDPRDVLTYGEKKYFYVYTEGDKVYLESGRNHHNASNISTRRALDKENLNDIYNAYKTEVKSNNIKKITFNSVYWFGIFRDLKL